MLICHVLHILPQLTLKVRNMRQRGMPRQSAIPCRGSHGYLLFGKTEQRAVACLPYINKSAACAWNMDASQNVMLTCSWQ